MRTLLVSDLHLGARNGGDVVRGEAGRAPLLEALAGADRLVVVGDLLELRHGALRAILDLARPALAEIGAAMAGREIVVLPGNHDHVLVRDRLESGAPLDLDAAPLAPAEASAAAQELAAALAPAEVRFAYPGLRVRDDTYALHGHYVDRHFTVPTFERLAAGAMGRVVGAVPERARPEDYEAALAPLYAWIHAVAQGTSAGAMARSAGSSARTWHALNGNGRRRLGVRALGIAFPALVGGLNRIGLGPLRPDVSAEELRRAGLEAIGEVIRRLGIDAAHVVFGHTHRAGPLPGDDVAEWTAPTGARLHNLGSWIYQRHFLTSRGARNPYWPGGAIRLESDGGPPELLNLLAEAPAAALAPGRR